VSSYIEHINSNQQSLLCKILGIYKVVFSGKDFRCIVMQNLFFNLKDIRKVYDLKGSGANRLNMPIGSTENQSYFTGHDINFKIDKCGEPYIIRKKEGTSIMEMLLRDVEFLKSKSVIDYSLLLI
jgi:hypothetical protein